MKQVMRNFAILALLAGSMGLLVTVQPAFADNLYGSIRGTVTDPTGAAVVNALVEATNTDTGIVTRVTSNQTGSYVFPQLAIGNYRVSVSAKNFKTFRAAGVHLDLDQVFSLNVKLDLGAVAEVVEVEANPSQVETTSMQLTTTITGTQIVDLPLNGRDWTQLLQLQPGVQGASDRFGTAAVGNSYSSSGAETQQNSFLLNGTDSNDTSLNTPLVVPSPDAIGEFNMVSSTINPEYGRNSGAIVNAAIKNGTNQFHGDVFEFYRDTFLDAKPWFQQKAALFHQNQYGGTVGGPIVKDRAFFFFSYQGRHSATPQPAGFANSYNSFFLGQPTPTVYSQAERGGDFSADGAFGKKPIPFAMFGDSASICPVSSGTECQPNGKNSFQSLFSTGVVPTQDFSPLSQKILSQYVPLPNGANNSFQFNPLEIAKRDQYLGRIDEKLSSKDTVWFYGLFENDTTNDDLAFVGSNLPGFGSANPSKTYEYTLAWNHTFSPTMLNEARFAYLRFNYPSVTPLATQDPAAYGFTGITTSQAKQFSQLPIMAVAGRFSLGFSADGPQPRVQNTYQVVDNLSKVWGHHTLKFGFNMDRLEINNPFYSNLNGTYQFFGSGPFSTGNAAADFLLGIPDSYAQGSGSVIRARGREYYSYGQDQWQVRPSLTLTLGLAWDIETPYQNLYANGLVLDAFHPGQQSTVFPSAPVGLVFPGDKGVNQYGGATVKYNHLAPRFGFAWSPGDSHKWSVRGGIGLYYNRTESEATLQTLTNVPFSLTTAGGGVGGGSPAFANPYNSVNQVAIGKIPTVCPAGCTVTDNATPFPFSPPTNGAAVPSFAPFEPIGLNDVFYDPRLTVPRATNFNLNVQYQISKSTVATIGYVGSIARHQEGAYNMNPGGTATGNPAAVAAGAVSDFGLGATVCPADLNSSISGLPKGACLPGTFAYNANVYGEIGVFATNWNSNYNSLQASINRHFSSGLQLQAAYTWSRNFDYTSNLENSAFNNPGFNALNFARNYGPSANDAPQRLVLNYVYTLPFYKFGHRWKRLTDDWNLSGIATFQKGFPVGVFQTNFTDLQYSGSQSFFAAPDFVNATGAPLNINHNPRQTQQWVNPAAFVAPALGVQGTANRNPFYGPGLNFWDMALEKNVHFTESMYVQLRFETFDTFNHANFAPPVNNVSAGPAFGTIDNVLPISTTGAGRVVQLAGKFYF